LRLLEHKDHVIVFELVGPFVPVPLIVVVIVVDENDHRVGRRLVLDPLRTAVALVMTTPPA